MVKLTVYEEDFVTVKKECTAHMVKIPFGVIRKLMQIFNIENLNDTTQILNIVTQSWDSVVSVLDRIFPDIEPEEWDYVDAKELVGVVFALIKNATGELLRIPVDPKN